MVVGLMRQRPAAPGGKKPRPIQAMAKKPPQFGLTQQMASRQAVRRILLHLLEAMEANRPGAVAGRDPEALHDFRVAVRRSRAALGQFRGVFPAAELDPFRGEFRWLGEVSGPARDLDVYLLQFPTYQSALPEAYRADLAPLHALLHARRDQARRRLAQALASPRYQSLVEEWRSFLCAPEVDGPEAEKAREPIADLAGRRVRKLFSRVRKNGSQIDDSSPATEWHALRIRCKKLRYLLEFCAELYPPKPLRRLIRQLRALQDNLGAVQDLAVQSRTLAVFAAELRAAAETPTRTVLAMGMLIQDLERRQEAERENFAKHFHRFTRKRNRRLFRNLFASPGKGE